MSKLNTTQAVQAANDLYTLRHMMPEVQKRTIADALKGEEGSHFAEVLRTYAERFKTCPRTYDQDGMGVDAVVYWHYFRGSIDAWVTELDKGDVNDERQVQAFGAINLMGTGLQVSGAGEDRYISGDAELGYISIAELVHHGVELDLYWTPKTLEECAK